MNRLAVGLELVLGLGVGANVWQLTDVAQGFEYQADGFGLVKIDGVCSVTPASVSCWRPDGTLDQALTADVDRQLQRQGAPRLSLQFGTRNLLLAMSEPLSNRNHVNTFLPGTKRISANSYYSSNGLESEPRGDRLHTLLYLRAVENLSHIEQTMGIPIIGRSSRIAMRPGAKIQIGDASIVLGSVTKFPNPWWLQSAAQAYRIAFKCEGAQSGVHFDVEVLDLTGKPLLVRPPAGSPATQAPAAPYEYEDRGERSDQRGWIVRCKPGDIGFLELRPVYTRDVTFHGIPLDPRP